jgi:hypothetical protein
VLDLDNPLVGRFGEVDQMGCERLAALYVDDHRRYPE